MLSMAMGNTPIQLPSLWPVDITSGVHKNSESSGDHSQITSTGPESADNILLMAETKRCCFKTNESHNIILLSSLSRQSTMVPNDKLLTAERRNCMAGLRLCFQLLWFLQDCTTSPVFRRFSVQIPCSPPPPPPFLEDFVYLQYKLQTNTPPPPLLLQNSWICPCPLPWKTEGKESSQTPKKVQHQ